MDVLGHGKVLQSVKQVQQAAGGNKVTLPAALTKKLGTGSYQLRLTFKNPNISTPGTDTIKLKVTKATGPTFPAKKPKQKP